MTKLHKLHLHIQYGDFVIGTPMLGHSNGGGEEEDGLSF